jgi:outer membrane receptor protein involved in Fe transport
VAVGWAPARPWSAFASWSYASREPAFRDLYDGEGVGNLPLFRYAIPPDNFANPLIRPEHVNDYELGGAWRGAAASASINLFRMDFRDELVFAGQFDTDLGYPILGNAARSVHQGAELALRGERSLVLGVSASLEGNATLSDNHFVRYREVYGLTSSDTLHYDGKQIALFPAVMGNVAARLRAGGASIGAEMQHAGRIYVDNTQNMLASIGPHTVLNLSAAWRMRAGGAAGAADAADAARDLAPAGGRLSEGASGPGVELSVRVLNALDNHYATSGYMDYDAAGNLVPQFVPAATRAVLGQVRVDF